MNTNAPLLQNKKLTVLYRVEPGCLGPQGKDDVEEFCRFAQQILVAVESDIVCWEMVPRFNKVLAEIEYSVGGKMLTRDQASRYLDSFSKNLTALEEQLQESLAQLIDDFFQR